MAYKAEHDGLPIKKRYGQHFLRQAWVTDHILEQVSLTPHTSIFEIGCGDGFLTRAILTQPVGRLVVFEIDEYWANFVEKSIQDSRLTVYLENILDVDLNKKLIDHQPWTLLANLPYQITFPILHSLQKHRHILREGVIMVQEEVAQKIVKTEGRGYGYPSLFFQHYFVWKVLKKVPPSAFLPPPKVDSRLLYFTPRNNMPIIPDEEKFWRFIKFCFKQPRRTLLNNLSQTHYPVERIDAKTLALRAQQMNMQDFLTVWDIVRA